MTTLEGTLTLNRAHLALVGQPDTDITFGTSGRSDANTYTGSFRAYANGSTRLILGTANTRVESLTMVITLAQKEQLDAMLGKTCVFRDTYGRKLFVSFLATTDVDIPLSGGLKNVTVALQVVTYSEAV